MHSVGNLSGDAIFPGFFSIGKIARTRRRPSIGRLPGRREDCLRAIGERVADTPLFELGGTLIVTPLASALTGHGIAALGVLAIGLTQAGRS